MYSQYMCLELYVKLIWCNSLHIHFGGVYIYCSFELGGRCMLSICAFWYIWCTICGAVVGGRCMLSICAFCIVKLIWCRFYRSIVNWSGVGVDVYICHSAICETYLV